VLLNAMVGMAGWYLWRRDLIQLRPNSWLRCGVDLLVMLIAMDFGMYVLHRLVHHRWLYPWFHRFHHRHEATNPLSLFVLHPLEVAGFGALMIGFLMVWPMSEAGLCLYLVVNILTGTLGHSGVEPFPARAAQLPLIRWIGTSTFHAEHHEHRVFNFGFYTLLWDRLFGTLDPDYRRRFASAVEPSGEDRR
jgi:lathosterol oxidase